MPLNLKYSLQHIIKGVSDVWDLVASRGGVADCNQVNILPHRSMHKNLIGCKPLKKKGQAQFQMT